MEHNSNLGLTKQREVVLQVIRTAEHHLTANEVYNEAKNRLLTISFATVYNSLRYLKDAGHIAEIQFGFSGANRFDAKTTRHDHAICNKCGKLVARRVSQTRDAVFQIQTRIAGVDSARFMSRL